MTYAFDTTSRAYLGRVDPRNDYRGTHGSSSDPKQRAGTRLVVEPILNWVSGPANLPAHD